MAEELGNRGIEVLPLKFYDASGKRLPQDRLREELARMIRQHRPSLLHANSLSMGRLSGPVAAELQLPSLAHLRDIIKLNKRAVADLNCHTRLLAVSAATRDFHVSGGLAAEKTHVLHNGVDLDWFRPRPKSGYLHRELGLPPEIRLIGSIGQICLRKGQGVLVRAAATLADELADVHYVVVGQRYSDKDESREFEEGLHTAAGAALPGRFHFLGYRNDVAEMLNELTLLVHPARQEPLGRVLLEAAAAGVAVIATDVGGTREIFPPNSQSARLVAPDDCNALAAAISELLREESLRSNLSTAARRRASDAFGLDRAVGKLVEHYEETVRA